MIAKIVKGQGFKGVVNYILDQSKGTEIMDSDGIRLKNPETIIQSFISQAGMNPRLKKPVGHTSLDFSTQDKEKLTNELMAQIARDYMRQMGIKDTQYLIGRHFDKEHPHIHLLFNRVDNKGMTITDRNDHFRSEKICKELTRKYGLYFAQGKENVKEHRLREPDKTKYEIYNSLKQTIPNCQNWDQLIRTLKDQNTIVSFKNKGKTDEVQGVIFEKNGYTFNGSKVDRQFSYSKINQQLQLNGQKLRQPKTHENWVQDEILNVGSVFSNLLSQFQLPSNYNYDSDDLAAIRKFKKKKKKGLRR